ncbi:MAG: UDP-N-acetylmuramate--L-alanine ligase [Roseburia sp.]|nr:UDP-N-acetylmuramate--L-alanine ligase [Roseburia sp.]
MKIHFVGNLGVSMRALAALAAARGHTVTGSDRASGGHDGDNVVGCDLIVYTNAVPQDNEELVMARALGIPTVERATYLGELSKTYGSVIAVAGCHGKSTTTAMLGAAFSDRNPTVHVGVDGGSRVGSQRYFITEACEYKESFLQLKPDVGIVLNVQYDHPDYYRDDAQLIGAYKKFCARCKAVLVNGDDPLCEGLKGDAITFGLSETCKYRATNIRAENGCYGFDYYGSRRAKITLSVAGRHNVYNALATLAAADMCGVGIAESARGLSGFYGIPRRFERKGIAFGKTVLTDYAHHPTEIEATIATAREMFPSVAVVFQPHTYSRTESLMDGFVGALAKADTVVLAPIFSAREKPNGLSSHTLCRKLLEKTERAYCFDTFVEIVEYCKKIDTKALIFMGAGDIDKAAELFINSDEYNIY